MADTKLPVFGQRDFSAGMISAVNESVTPRNSVRIGLNVDFDIELGSAVTRAGTFIVGGQMVAGNSILGLHQHRGGSNKLFSVINDTNDLTSVIYDETGSVLVTGLTASKRMRFLTYGGETLMLNGSNAPRSWNETTFITTGGVFDLADFPATTCNIAAEYLDRVYTAGDDAHPSRLHFSTIFTGSVITWEGDYVDIEPEDAGGDLTAIGKVPGYLILFKERTMHRFNGTSTFPESLTNLGTPNQESVISEAGICGFFSASSRDAVGFYVTQGGRPEQISGNRVKNIQRWVDAIPPTEYGNISGWGDDAHFHWSVGDLTVDNQVYRNVVLRWSVATGEWCVRTYPTRFTRGTSFIDGEGNNVLVAGDDEGEVIELDKPSIFTDYVTVDSQVGYVNIPFDVRGYPERFNDNHKKSLNEKLVYVTENAKGTVPYVIVDKQKTYDFEEVSSDVSECRIGESLTGNYFQFGWKGSVQGQRHTLKEIEVPSITVHDSY